MNEIEKESEIKLSDLINIIKEKLLFLVMITLIFGLMFGAYAFMIVNPKYQSKGLLMVFKAENSTIVETNELTFARTLLTTVQGLIKEDMIIDRVLERNDIKEYNLTARQLRSNLEIRTNATDNLIIYVYYVSENEELAQTVVQAVLEESSGYFEENSGVLYNNRVKSIGNASEAVYHSPNKVLYVLIGVLLGGIIGLSIVFIKEAMKNTFETKEDLEKTLNIQVIGVIPNYHKKGNNDEK